MMNEDVNPTKQITVLQVLPELVSGGVERGTIEIAKAGVEAGFKMVVASAGGTMEKQLDAVGAKHVYAPLESKNPFTIFANKKQIKWIIDSEGVDIVHARSRAPAWSAYLATKDGSAKFITTFHGTYGRKNAFKRWYNGVMTKGERVIAISEHISRHMKENYAVPDDRITLIHRGVDLDYFNPDAVSQERIDVLKEKWRLTESWPIILMPARVTRWKGHDLLISALALMDKGEDFYCVMVGNAAGHEEYLSELNRGIGSAGLSDKVKIVAAVDDMPAAYAMAKIVVSASIEPEAFGRVAIEAQAMGKPIVATDLGGSKETVIHGETGRLVSPMFPKDMAEGLEKGITLDQIYQKDVAGVNRKHIVDNFSAKKMCDATLNVYRELMGQA
jgi:glycosyltransferase involved in cell wall biosynthesis